MREIKISVEKLLNSLLELSKTEQVCILDSGGVSYLGSHFLIAGIRPNEILEINENAEDNLKVFEEKTSQYFASVFTLAYKLGLKLNKIEAKSKNEIQFHEPDIFAYFFDCLVIYDYELQKTFLVGNAEKFNEIENLVLNKSYSTFELSTLKSTIKSNFTKIEYLEKIEQIQEFIRCGETYQTNLTQQLTIDLAEEQTPQSIYYKLRNQNPAPFSAFIKRRDDFVISASPERFFQATISKDSSVKSTISTSPIKGTRRRGANFEEDEKLKNALLNSEKDRAENTMIVDLLRNDLGRVCKFGSVAVEKLCDLETHPTLFHLVSTISGELKQNVGISEILKAVFPCGSITGAPKIRTMQIIEQLETSDRGLSMGAIGFSIQNSDAEFAYFPLDSIYFDLSVAIRTMVLRGNKAYFNVGGGIVIDSEPEDEYEETLTKAKALMSAVNGEFSS
ncbi:MAG TPA: aminodeoxychorismate synthase component I [Pyrinomonadaceae bacterium]|nr:aminodeoxychorismate synthase component I [Pyrinomonadaceae bacterium]